MSARVHEGDRFPYLDDEKIAPEDNANPVVTLRMRFDEWRRASRL